MAKLDVEKGLISKLLELKSFDEVVNNQINEQFFVGDSKNAFAFISEELLTTGEIPSVRAFKRAFPNYTLETYSVDGKDTIGTEEGISFWCKELRRKVKHNYMVSQVEEIVEKLNDFKGEEAYTQLKKAISYIDTEIQETHDVDITKNSYLRKQRYIERRKCGGITGIPTGFSQLDRLIRGLEKKTLTTVIAKTGVGKAVTLNTPVLTPNGFIPMRKVTLGTSVIASDGKAYPVTGVYPQGLKPAYRVSFEDGTYVDCCKEHLWVYKTTDDVQSEHNWRVATLQDIMTNHPIKRGKSYNLFMPVVKPIEDFSSEKLPLDPYVMGALLGDGGFTTDRVSFSSIDPSLVDKLNTRLKAWGSFVSNTDKNVQYLFKSHDPRCNSLYRTIKSLDLIGTNSETKFVPSLYLTASMEDRLELVRGLVDTDGTVSSKGAVSYYTGSENLCKSFVFLIRSLGYRCRVHKYTRSSKYLPEYKVFVCGKITELFSTAHRLEQFNKATKSSKQKYYNMMKVVSIKPLNYRKEMQCITVDSPDHTFVCGDFIVTHNTWIEIIIGCFCSLSSYKVLQFVTEMSEELMQDRYDATLYSLCEEPLSYADFKDGKLTPKQEKKFFNFLDNTMPNLVPIIIAQATDVLDMSAKIDKYKPDLVLVDGVYLMEDTAKDDWLRITNITRGVKKLAKSKGIPIVINTQADKNTSKKTGPELDSIMYTQAIGQDSDNVIALWRDEVMIQDNEMGIRVLKQREGELGKLVCNWDFRRMDFSEIYTEKAHENEESSDNNTVNYEEED